MQFCCLTASPMPPAHTAGFLTTGWGMRAQQRWLASCRPTQVTRLAGPAALHSSMCSCVVELNQCTAHIWRPSCCQVASLARQAHPRKLATLCAAGMLEIHLSHNMLTLRGATALLEVLPVHSSTAAQPTVAAGAAAEVQGAEAGIAARGGTAAQQASVSGGEPESAAAGETPSKPVWLRLEWNRISLGGLMQVRLGGGRQKCRVLGRACGWCGLLLPSPWSSTQHSPQLFEQPDAAALPSSVHAVTGGAA